MCTQLLLIGYFLLFIGLSFPFCSGQSFNGMTNLRDMLNLCEENPDRFKCYYFDEDPAKDPEDPNSSCLKERNCAAILSIEEFMPSQCSQNTQPELNKIFCCEVEKRKGKLYQVTLGRRFEGDKNSCAGDRKSCIPREFIAVAFSNNTDPDDEPNPYFVCNNRDQYVHSVLQDKFKNSTQKQMTFTSPFPRMAIGIFWSHIINGDDGSLICTFLLSSRRFDYIFPPDEADFAKYIDPMKKNATTTPTNVENYACTGIEQSNEQDEYCNETAHSLACGNFEFGKFDWNIKVARGRANRNEKRNIINVPINSTSSCGKKSESAIFDNECDQSQIWIVKNKLTPDVIPPVPNVTTEDPITKYGNQIESKEAIEKVHKKCLEKKSLCYLLKNERGCLHKQNCHMLVAVSAVQTDFERLHFDMILQTKGAQGEQRLVRPKGWGAWALSFDKTMGNDFVFICASNGAKKVKAYPTLNIRRTNLYFPDQPYQKLFTNAKTFIWKREPEVEPRVMCSFDIVTKFEVTEEPVINSTLKYNLKEEEYFVLMAMGTSVSENWAISYHSRFNREKAEIAFSKKIYDELTSGVSGCIMYPIMRFGFLIVFGKWIAQFLEYL